MKKKFIKPEVNMIPGESCLLTGSNDSSVKIPIADEYDNNYRQAKMAFLEF